MTRTRIRPTVPRPIAALAALAAAGLLAGCGGEGSEQATDPAPAPSTTAGTTPEPGEVPEQVPEQVEVDAPPAGELDPELTLDGDALVLTTYGSSGCPAEVTAVRALDSDTLEVDVDATVPKGQLCTADLGPNPSPLELPDGVAAADVVDAVVTTVEDTGSSTVLVTLGAGAPAPGE